MNEWTNVCTVSHKSLVLGETLTQSKLGPWILTRPSAALSETCADSGFCLYWLKSSPTWSSVILVRFDLMYVLRGFAFHDYKIKKGNLTPVSFNLSNHSSPVLISSNELKPDQKEQTDVSIKCYHKPSRPMDYMGVNIQLHALWINSHLFFIIIWKQVNIKI